MSGMSPARDWQPARERPQVPDHWRVDLHRRSATLPSSASIFAHCSRASRVSRVMVKALRDLARAAPAVFLHAQQEGRAHPVDGRVGHRGGDDFALQAVLLHRLWRTSPAAAAGIANFSSCSGTDLPASGSSSCWNATSFGYDSSTASSGRVRPRPRALRSAISASEGQEFDLPVEQAPAIPACG